MTRAQCWTVAGVCWLAAMLAAPADAVAQAAAPDVVRLKDGGMLRGTIVELVAGRTVEITLPSGQTRKLPMSTVSYAGPASRDPEAEEEDDEEDEGPSASPAPPVAKSVLFQSPQAGVKFHLMGAQDRACVAPCRMDVQPGRYNLALSLNKARPVAVPPLSVDGPVRVTGQVDSRLRTRTFGVMLLVLGTSLAGSLAASAKDNDSEQRTMAVMTLLASHVIGWPCAFVRDKPSVSVQPLSNGASH